MPTPAERMQGWIDSLAVAWKDRLKGWTSGVIGFGIEVFADVVGKKLSVSLKPLIDKIESETVIPPEFKPLWDEMKNPTGEIAALISGRITSGVMGGTISAMMEYLLRPMITGLSFAPGFFLFKPDYLISAYRRHMISKDDFNLLMRMNGIDTENAENLLELGTVRFPSEVVSQLYLRDPAKYDSWWDEVKQLGVDDKHIEALKELMFRVPAAADVIRYMVKEVYDPSTYRAFGQDQEFPGGATDFTADALTDARKSGVTREHLLKEWISHWNLPSAGEGFDLLHRGLINESELDKLLKALDIMPFWRDKLVNLSWGVPNRVELRMLARYGLRNKAELVDDLKRAGLGEEYRPLMADLMLAQGMLSDLSKRYANKWINSEELKAELTESGISDDIGSRMYDWIVKNNAGDRVKAPKDLTESEIVKGVKLGQLTWPEGVKQLIALGYDELEADYVLTINVELAPTSAPPELTVQVDTIRRQRRQRLIDRGTEIGRFSELKITPELAEAYADNDDMRLVKVAVKKPPEILLEYETDSGKVQVETVRTARRQQAISRIEEISSLTAIEMPPDLATAIADNDDLRLARIPVEPVILAIPQYQTDAGKVQVETIRLLTRQRKMSAPQTSAEIAAGIPPVYLSGDDAKQREVNLLMALDMSNELAEAYADNDELRLVKITGV